MTNRFARHTTTNAARSFTVGDRVRRIGADSWQSTGIVTIVDVGEKNDEPVADLSDNTWAYFDQLQHVSR